MGILDNIFQEINRSLNDAAGEPAMAMGTVFTRFLAESGAVWHHDAFALRIGNVVLGTRIRTLESGHEGIELVGKALWPPAVRILRRRGWGDAPLPPWVAPLRALPLIASDPLLGVVTQSDEPELAALAALEPAWDAMVRAAPFGFLACDGYAVTAQLAPPMTVVSVHAAAAAVAAHALSSPVASTLASLEGASATQGGDLAPSVSLEPDGLQIGIGLGPRTIARLGGVSGGADAGGETRALLARAGHPLLAVTGGVATLTWPVVERDLGRLRAGVAALRSLASQAVPYR